MHKCVLKALKQKYKEKQKTTGKNMAKESKYTSRQSDANGVIDWPADENDTWNKLVTRQLELMPGRACDEFMNGMKLLDLPHDRVPQLNQVNEVLGDTTGWQVAEVPALINFDEFFRLLSNKQFPVATFIRTKEEFDYLQEPDIFHEIFGHCPLLTNPAFAHFTHTYGRLGYSASKEDRVFLARLYWFTVEFGLLKTEKGLRIYGGGILSSPGETIAALEDPSVRRTDLDVIDVMRTPYRIDIMQPAYFLLNGMDQLYELSEMDLLAKVQEAKALGLHEPLFPPKIKKAS
ncbi:phenylalanine 4-monooxygenase [Alteromonas sp. a30]|uniref:phenylalanine 4-monooxygenase n=1 Tax=Alteromonas sp. a30 TaxID=2730917 RepID=UPI00227E22A0|nr:phenylalanine 4-monooxygenase [Alteromonas sp. a30]